MRIIGEIAHPNYKITVFQHNNRTSVQFENGLVQQTYKYRDGSGVDTVEAVENCITEEFLANVDATFELQLKNYYASLERDLDDDLGFEII